MDYLVRADQPFRGFAQSVVVNGIVAYSDGLTVEEYRRDRGFPVEVVSETDFFARLKTYHDTLVTDPVEETKEQWWDALEVLPPCRWRTVNGIEFFHISERLTGNLVAWHARKGRGFWRFTDYADASYEKLVAKMNTTSKGTA